MNIYQHKQNRIRFEYFMEIYILFLQKQQQMIFNEQTH